MPEPPDFQLAVREQDFILVLFLSFNLLIVLYTLFRLILLGTQLCHYWLNTKQKSKVSLHKLNIVYPTNKRLFPKMQNSF